MADQQEAQQEASGCEICRNTEASRCRGCQCSRYCSQACQKTGWSKHKLVCKTFKDFADDKRPGPNFHRAIYFPPHEETLCFIWLEFERKVDQDKTLDVPKSDLMGKDALGVQFKSTQQIHAHSIVDCIHRIMPHTIVLQTRDAGSIDSCGPNAAIKNLHEARHGYMNQTHEWEGPVVAFGMNLEETSYTAEDLDTTDFRYIIDGLCGHFHTAPPDYHLERLIKEAKHKDQVADDDVILGVRINCDADVFCNSRPKFEQVMLPKTHSIFKVSECPPLTNHLGLPLQIKKLPHDTNWKTFVALAFPFASYMAGPENMELENLFVVVDPAAPKHGCGDACVHSSLMDTIDGWAPSGHASGSGSSLVARKDGKPLFPHQVEALSDFAWDKVCPVVGPQVKALGEGKAIDKNLVLRKVNKQTFSEYFKQWKKNKYCACHIHLYASPFEMAD